MSARSAQIQGLLAAETSALRTELAALTYDALARLPLATFVVRADLLEAISLACTRSNVELLAARHVAPALERVAQLLAGRSETVRDAVSATGEAQLRALVRAGDGPRFAWLRGAVDSDDLRRLIAPVVQQLLQQFTARLPIPGLSAAAGGAGGALGGLVGRLGKQVQRGAGQLADVGRSMLGGAIRDFSETATSDFRAALKERLASPEGQRIVEQMRERFVGHVLGVELEAVVQDLMRQPPQATAALVATVLEHQRELPLSRLLLEGELDALLRQLEAQSGEALLRELGLHDAARAHALRAIDAAVRAVAESTAFGTWLERLLVAAPAEET